MDGEPAAAEATGAEAAVNPAQDAGAQVEGGEQGSKNLEVELATVKERYKHSSEEGIRLHNELKEARERLAKLEQNSSLTQIQQQQQAPRSGLPDRQTYVKYWTENGDKTEKEAAAEYDREVWLLSQVQGIQQAMELSTRRQQFEAQQREAAMTMLNPEAKEAEEFFKATPEFAPMAGLPMTDKIKAYQALKPRLAQKPGGKDLSGIKAAAGGTVGGSARGSGPVSSTAEDEATARRGGFPSAAAMRDFKSVHTDADYSEWAKRWKIKS